MTYGLINFYKETLSLGMQIALYKVQSGEQLKQFRERPLE
jgi:hypothetical protein